VRKQIFTNGCFDLLHPGHLSLLEYCSSLGEVIVGLNSDDSVRRLKGIERPIWPVEMRRYALESCRFVNKVVVFEEDTPETLIRELRPDLIVKGGEYEGGYVVGQEVAPVKFFRPVWNVSTTEVVRVIREGGLA
jgi:rfaE bifunctional protein nucleotidyltransferase chain/domain